MILIDIIRVTDFLKRYKLQVSIVSIYFAVMLFFISRSPGTFLSFTFYRSVLQTYSYVGLMALGLMLVVTMGEIDLSYPSVMCISGYLFACVYAATGNPALALLVALAAGVVAGSLSGFLVTKIGMPSFVATVGGLFLWRGIAHVASGGCSITVPEIRETFLCDAFTTNIGGAIPIQFLWFILFAVLVWILLNRYRFGSGISFIGDNKESAKMLGINVNRTKILTFVIAGMLASLAAVIQICGSPTWFTTQGTGFFLPVFAMVFVGGTAISGGRGAVFGTFIGALLIGTMYSGLPAAGFSGVGLPDMSFGVLLIIAVIVYTLMEKRGAV